MERLSKRTPDGKVAYALLQAGECVDPIDLLRVWGDRLAAYEDAMPLERAQELAQAEKGGRLVVMPDVKYTDADGEKALQKAMWTCGNTNNPVTRYTADAIAEKLCREAKEENPPLTLEELREMDGEPVWVVQTSSKLRPFWMLIDAEDESAASRLYCAMFEDYGTEWLAYRRKPEEGAA